MNTFLSGTVHLVATFVLRTKDSTQGLAKVSHTFSLAQLHTWRTPRVLAFYSRPTDFLKSWRDTFRAPQEYLFSIVALWAPWKTGAYSVLPGMILSAFDSKRGYHASLQPRSRFADRFLSL